MDASLLVSLAVGGGIFAAMWAVLSMFSGRSNRAMERLEEIRKPIVRNKDGRPVTEEEGGFANVMKRAAPALSKVLEPKSDLEKSTLKLRLANAGFSTPLAPQVYLAIKSICLLTGVVLGSGIGMGVYGLTQKGMYGVVIGAGLGFYAPELVLWFIKRGRQERIFLSLPDALDLLVVCVEAGLGLDAGMRRVTEELKDTAPDLCNEFAMCNFQLQIGRPRKEVLHDLGVRSGVDDLKALAAILIQADRFGSSVGQALRVQSDSMRTKRSQLAEERAQKTAVQMIFPLVLFIFPGIFVVLVGPAAISMINNLFSVH